MRTEQKTRPCLSVLGAGFCVFVCALPRVPILAGLCQAGKAGASSQEDNVDQEDIRYQVLRAIDQVQSHYPSNYVTDSQIVEITDLDLQTARDEMDLLGAEGYTQAANSNDGKRAMLNARGRRLLKDIAARRSQPPRARDVEQRTLEFLLRYEEAGRPSVLAGSGVWVGGTTIAEELRLGTQLIQDSLENLAERGCVQLKQYISGPDRLVASLTGRGRTIAREPEYTPSTQSASGIHITYNQQGQQVTYQYNAAGNINFGAVQNRQDLIVELEKLQADLSKAVDDPSIDADVVLDAETAVRKAIVQAKKPEPDKKTILDRLNEAKALLAGVGAAAGAIEALLKAVDFVQKHF